MIRRMGRGKVGKIPQGESFTTQDFFRAIKSGDCELLRILLPNLPFSVNTLDAKGNTGLFTGVSLGNVELVKLLGEYGADVTMRSRRGDTILHMAARRGDKAMCEALLAMGIAIDVKDRKGKLAVEYVPKKHTALRNFLTPQRVPRPIIHPTPIIHPQPEYPPPQPQLPPLDPLVAKGWFDRIKVGDGRGVLEMIRRGIHVDIRNRHGMSGLHLASYRGRMEVISILCDYGANLSAISPSDGTIPLHWAAWTGAFNCVAVLLTYGSPTQILNYAGDSAVGCAVKGGHMDVVQLMQTFRESVRQPSHRPNYQPQLVDYEGVHSHLYDPSLVNVRPREEVSMEGGYQCEIAVVEKPAVEAPVETPSVPAPDRYAYFDDSYCSSGEEDAEDSPNPDISTL